MSKYGEKLCQAIETIAKSSYEKEINRDLTITGIIKKVVDKENGEYLIKYQQSNFLAYSLKQTYRENDKVYVTIPQGDFSKQKFIQGKETTDGDNSFVFTRPFDDFIDLTGDILVDKGVSENGFGLVAKGEQEETDIIISHTFENSNMGFSTLGLSADFKTLISALEPIDGVFGIKMNVYHGEEGNYTTMIFNSKNMYGDPYNFQTWFGQEALFDISEIKDMKKIEITFFQNSFAFSNFPESQEEQEIYYSIKNLFVNNIKVFLGYKVSEIKDELAYVFTNEKTEFPFEKDSTRKLQLRWVHKNGDKFIQIKPDFEEEFEIRWYHYALGAPSADEYSGAHWESIENGKNFEITVKPDPTKKEEKYKAIIIYQNTPIRSNVLAFINENDVPDSPTLDAIYNTKLHCNDGTNGQYFIYDENDQSLYDENGTMVSNITRRLAIWYKDSELTDWDAGTEITWIYPTEDTMIEVQSTSGIYLDYKLSSRYQSRKGNNTIEARFIRRGITYRGIITFSFGLSSSAGTDFVISVYETENKIGLPYNNSTSLNFRAQIQDRYGKPVTPETTPSFKWEMMSGGNALTTVPNGDRCEVKWKSSSSATYDIVGILKVTVNKFGDYPLEYKYPLLIYDSTKVSKVIAPSRVEYKSDGTNPIYYKNEIEAFDLQGDHIGGYFEIYPSNSSATISDRGKLQPKGYYDKNDKPYAIQQVDHKDVKIFSQAVVLDFNTYSSSLVNSWDGRELQIDYKNSAILSKMIAAGSKNNLNQFSGVVMGDCIGDDSLRYTGLYGFYNGAQAFAFKEDGTGFIGVSGAGRIKFDGNTGSIESGNYDPTRVAGNIKTHKFITSGTKIDLDDGHIKTPYFEVDGKNAYFNGAIHATEITLSSEAEDTIVNITPKNAEYAKYLGSPDAGSYSYTSLKNILRDKADLDDLNDFVTSRELGDLAFMDEVDLGLTEVAKLSVTELWAEIVYANKIIAEEIQVGSVYFMRGYGNAGGGQRTEGAKMCEGVRDNPDTYFIVTRTGCRMKDGNAYMGVWNGMAHSSDDLSDIRIKKNIGYDLLDKYEDFYMSLKPTYYNFTFQEEPYTFVGFIAQEVEQSLYNNGLSNYDFGAIQKINDAEMPDGIKYSLKYQNFIALNTAMIQKLYKKIDILEQEIKELKDNGKK